jgi:hypothetical protein
MLNLRTLALSGLTLVANATHLPQATIGRHLSPVTLYREMPSGSFAEISHGNTILARPRGGFPERKFPHATSHQNTLAYSPVNTDALEQRSLTSTASGYTHTGDHYETLYSSPSSMEAIVAADNFEAAQPVMLAPDKPRSVDSKPINHIFVPKNIRPKKQTFGPPNQRTPKASNHNLIKHRNRD